MSVTLDQITGDDDEYHRRMSHRTPNVPTRQDLARVDVAETRQLIDGLRVFIVSTMCRVSLFWYDRRSDVQHRLDAGGRLLPEDVRHMSARNIAAYLPTTKRSRRCEHALVIIREMLPILADAEKRLSEAEARAR